MTSINVDCTVIPDGPAEAENTFRVSVVLTPNPHAKSAALDLENWPQKISDGAGKKKLYVSVIYSDGRKTETAYFEPSEFNNWPKRHREQAVRDSNALWRGIFRNYDKPGDVYRFDDLVKIFDKTTKPAAPGLLRFGSTTVDPAAIRFTGTYALTKSMVHLKNLRIATRYLYGNVVARIRDARRKNNKMSDELSALAEKGPIATLLARPFSDPLLDFRLQAAECFGFTDLRSDAIGRLDSLAQIRSSRVSAEPQANAKSVEGSFAEYEKKAKEGFKDFSGGIFKTARNIGDQTDETLALQSIPEWLETEFLATMPPNDDLKLYASESVKSALASLLRSQLVAQKMTHPIEPKPEKQADDDLRRKFAGIRSLPTLAKFLGFIVDVEVKITGYKPGEEFYVVAGFDTEAGFAQNFESLDRTACIVGPDRSFCAASKPGANDYVVQQGLLYFGQNKDNAYSIEAVDGTLMLQSFAHESANLLDAVSNGAMADTLGTKLPETPMRGLQILHKEGPRQAVGSINRAKERTKALTSGTPTAQVLYAENLLIGFRLDAQRTKINSLTDATPVKELDWASLTARSVVIEEVRSAFPDRSRHPYPDCRERDFGVLRRVQKQVPLGNGNVGPGPSQVLATWMGDHLGVPTPQFDSIDGKAHAKTRHADIQADLGLTIDFDFSKLKEDIAPVLRIGDGYRFGLRAVMPNGASLSLAAAKKLYKEKKFVLGDGEHPHNYRFYGDVRPPQLLLPPDDPLARSAQSSDKPNERDDRIVLRPRSDGGHRKVRRFLVPSRVSFEQAEQFGLLDDQRERQVPLGAFRKFKRDRKTGAFPSVKNGRVEEISDTRHPVTGTVLVSLARAVEDESAPYFPDPLGRNLKVMFERNLAIPNGYEQVSPERSFWNNGGSPLSAAPILLELRTNDAIGSGGRFIPAESYETVAGVKFQKLAIEIAPGETVTLWYWALPDRSEERALCAHTLGALTAFNVWQKDKNSLIPKILGGDAFKEVDDYLKSIRTEPASRGHRLEDPSRSGRKPGRAEIMVDKWMTNAEALPNFDTKGWGKIDVVYAVEKPLRVPVFRTIGGKLAFKPVRIAPENKWGEVLVKKLSEQQPPFQNERGGTTIYITGVLEFDRRSTVELSADFAAEDFSDARAVTKVGDKWRFAPAVRRDQLFRVSGIPVDHGGNEPGTFDLARDEAGTLRGLSYDFGQITSQNATAAHEINVRLVARSRFEREFDSDPNDPHQFERESRPAFGKADRSVPNESHDKPTGHTSVAQDIKVWIKSTERPPKPVVERVSWISPERISRTNGKITVERWCFPRIHLPRPWFVSGADELLAVICGPANLIDDRPFDRYAKPGSLIEPWDLSPREKSRADEIRRLTLQEFEKPNSLAAVAEYVTRWGADPTTESGKLEPVIAPERFRGFVATAQNIPLPLQKLEKPAMLAKSRRVGTDSHPPTLPLISAFLYKPQFDEQQGSWYVDVGIDPGAAHLPFVQLSIARFQPHSLDGISLSEPLILDPIQIPAKRTVEIDLIDDKRVVAKVQGVGYVRRAPFGSEGPAPGSWREMTDVPLQNVQLLRRNGPAAGPVAAFDVRGKRIEKLRVQPIANGTDLIWICPFDLPAARSSTSQYDVQFDEVELHVPDEDLQVTTSTSDAKFFVEKPGMFSCRVSL